MAAITTLAKYGGMASGFNGMTGPCANGTPNFWQIPGLLNILAICIFVIATLGYVRLLLRRRRRRALRAERDEAEQREGMVARLRDTFLWEKESDQDSKQDNKD